MNFLFVSMVLQLLIYFPKNCNWNYLAQWKFITRSQGFFLSGNGFVSFSKGNEQFKLMKWNFESHLNGNLQKILQLKAWNTINCSQNITLKL